jgi:hypothetical protein
VQDTGSGVRVTIVNDGPLGGRLNGATRYDVYWSEEVDTTTAAGKAAGFARAVCLAPSIPATNVDHTQSSGLYTDPKYAAGYFYACGVDTAGKRSEPSEPAQVITGPIDNTIPGDVRHLQISESGAVSNGTVFSELSVTCEVPAENVANFGGVQLYLKDYLSLGDTQEGFFQKWNGSGGINFAPLYPIPRRRSSVSVTATNGSANVTAASGLLSVARAGEQFELLGQKILINTVTDTQITLASNWLLSTISTSDYVIIGKPTIYAVSVSKAGTRRADVENAPSIAVLMDGEISVPNSPATLNTGKAGVAVRIEWPQVAGSTIKEYSVYRSGTPEDLAMQNTPPRPAAGTTLLTTVAHNPNLPSGTTLQHDDSNFTPYELEANVEFWWYVTTRNIRGDESDAIAAIDACRTAGGNEIDPVVPGTSYGKNLLFNAGLGGTAGNPVLASDTSQDAFNGTDATNLPGVPYGVATAQANGTGRFQGYTRWEATDAGTGSSGTVTFENGDEIHIPGPGAGNVWYILSEIGAWDHATAQHRKIEKGGVYTLSVYVSHAGVAPDGNLSCYLEHYDNNTFRSQALRRYRDTNSTIQTSSTGLDISGSDIIATPLRYQASFQMDAAAGTVRQIRVNFARFDGTTGVIVLRKVMLNKAEVAGQWTVDMGDPSVSLPIPANPITPPDDWRTERIGDARVQVP